MFYRKLIVLLFFENVLVTTCHRRGGYGGGHHGHGHGHGFNNWNGHNNNGWGQPFNGNSWGQPFNGNGWGNNGFGQQGNVNGHGWQWGQQQQNNFVSCFRPTFDDGAQLTIDNCASERHHEACWNFSKDIPVDWKVTISCRKESTTIQVTSTCSSLGEWDPPMHKSCDSIIRQSLSSIIPLKNVDHHESNFPTIQASTSSPVINHHLTPKPAQQNKNPHHVNSGLNRCPMLYMKLSANFIFNCIFPEDDTETENCLNFESVPSGTIAKLKCKPPFYSDEESLSEWVCENKIWKGDFHQKLKCFQSSSPRPHRPSPSRRPTSPRTTTTTTTSTTPRTIWTTPTSHNVHVDQDQDPRPSPIPTHPPPVEEHPQVWWTTPKTTQRPVQKVTTKVTTTTTRRPTTRVTTTTTTLRPTTQSTTTQVPTSSTAKSTAGCPPLFPRSAGIVLECVSSIGGSVTQNACDVFQPADAEAKYSCKEYYESTAGLVTLYRKCREDGTWTGSAESFNCVVQCGRNNVVFVPFITSGVPSFRGQWPWHSAIFLRETFSSSSTIKWTYACGGTLISKNAVATAAHCVTLFQSSKARNVTQLRIDLGRFEREKPDDIVQAKDISSIHVHPSYSPFGFDSDIAIVILKEEAEIGYHVRPICFPQTLSSALEELQVAENSLGTVVGWGYNENSELANELQMAQLQVASQQACSDSFGGSGIGLQAKSTTYCASLKNGTKFVNVCNGDSGGGMYFPLKNSDFTRWYLQGVVSLGIADEDRKCKPSSYSIFTRVGRYSDWIVRILSENNAL